MVRAQTGRDGVSVLNLIPPLAALALQGLPHPASLQCAQWILLWGVSLVAPLALRLAGHYPRLQIALTLTSLTMLLGYHLQGFWLLFASCLWLASTLAMAFEVSRQPGDITLKMAFLYAPVGGVWAVASAWKHGLMGFDPLMTLLTADHFCYVTLGATVWASQAGRKLGRSTAYRWLIRLLWISPALVAVGITLSHYLGQVTLVECLGVTAQVAATSGISMLWLVRGPSNPGLKHLGTVLVVNHGPGSKLRLGPLVADGTPGTGLDDSLPRAGQRPGICHLGPSRLELQSHVDVLHVVVVVDGGQKGFHFR